MNILAFDTSTEKFSISILKNNKVILNLSKILNKTYSKFLIPLIKESLFKSQLDVKKINHILVSLGPGSFTGIRLGIAAAKGLGIPYKIKISGYNNMNVLAHSINDNINGRKIVVLIKSKKEDFYFQSFNSNRQPLKKVSSFPISNLPKYFFNKNLIFCGNLNIKLIKELRKKKLYLHKNKFYNSELIINLFRKKKIKVTKSLDPIYVYEHYAKKN